MRCHISKMFGFRILTQTRPLIILIFGLVIGFTISQLLHNSNCLFSAHYSGFTSETSILSLESNQTTLHSTSPDNRTIADFLYNETRVLCWILTGPENHEKRARHVKNTWGGRCNKLIFMSSKEDADLGSVNLNIAEGRSGLWHKTREAFKYIYENHLDDADWFLKADDDTYVIVENLRGFLYQYDTEAPVYFGCKFKKFHKQGYMSGGAGYVLSKEAVRRFVEKAYPDATKCRQRKGGAEDSEIGNCLQNVGVVAGDSRDDYKRGRFFPSSPQGHLIPKDKTSWYWRYIFYATNDGLDCCSDYAVSFHYIQPNQFYMFDYLIYSLRPFGVVHSVPELPAKANMTELLEKWRNEKSDNPL